MARIDLEKFKLPEQDGALPQQDGIDLEKFRQPEQATPSPETGKKKGLLSRWAKRIAGPVQAPGRFFERAGVGLLGTSAEVVGSLIGQGVEAAFPKVEEKTGGVFTRKFQERFGSLEKALGVPEAQADPSGSLPSAVLGVGSLALDFLPGGTITKGLSKLPGINKIASGLKSAAEKQFGKALAPTTKKLKAQAEKVVPELIRRKESFWTPGILAKKARVKTGDLANSIDEAMAALPQEKVAEAGPVRETLQNLRSKYIVDDVVINKTAVRQIDEFIGVIDEVADNADNISLESWRSVRQIWDESYDVSKGLDDISAYNKKASRAGANAIRQIFAEETPNIAKLNAEYSFWAGVRDVAEATTKRKVGQQQTVRALRDTVSAGVLSSFGTGATSKTALAVMGALVSEIAASSKWRTVSAIQKDKLANAMLGEVPLTELRSVLRTVSNQVGVAVTDETWEVLFGGAPFSK